MNPAREINWDKEIAPRIKNLVTADFYLEALYLEAATVEQILRNTIENQEEWVESLLIQSGLSFHRISQKELEERSLGELISLFSRFSKDTRLISELNDFNSLRKTIVHHLLDYSIEQLNKLAKNKQPKYNQLLAKIYRHDVELSEKFIRKYKRILRKIRVSR